MADLVFIVMIVAFFGLAVLLVRACDRMIGPDEQARSATDQTPPADSLAA